ncbi:hypothetical protein GCM10009549_36560 [Streptomyces thermoalcalitolerans]|uniref:Uncharacterized protein n=1 Tax=Streptomyces thermoalcalitolerans TaxID=65605 RepID=A0ABP3ZCY2_9ACTN
MTHGHALLVDAFGVRGEQFVGEEAGTGDEGMRGDGHGSDFPGTAPRGAGAGDVSFVREEHDRAEKRDGTEGVTGYCPPGVIRPGERLSPSAGVLAESMAGAGGAFHRELREAGARILPASRTVRGRPGRRGRATC